MRLVRLRVERFRGIRSLDWTVPDRLVCLVGPGDSGKSTILEAISLVASPRSTISLTDDDFFKGNAANGFSVEATFADLPDGTSLLAESRFGLLLGGVDADGVLHDEPGDHEPTITVRLDVDPSLEAMWRVITASNSEGRMIGQRDRAALGVALVGSNLDRQFTWARGSALARASGEDVSGILLDVYREMGEALGNIDLTVLDDTVGMVRASGTRMGVGPVAGDLGIGIDLSRITGAALTLQARGVPVSSSGLGTRRLLALALELRASPTGGVVCLDEIESGLEPHRLRHLMAALRVIAEGANGTGSGRGQVLFTSHSPTVIEELGARHLFVMRGDDGAVAITRVHEDLNAVVRANAASLLSRKVVVSEGKTEIGLIRGHEAAWAARHNEKSLAYMGVAVAYGGGSEAPQRAKRLRALGYPTLLFADSDREINPSAEELRASDVEVVQWDGGMCTEQRLATDLSWSAFVTLFSRLPDVGLDPGECLAKMLSTEPAKKKLNELGKKPDEVGDCLEDIRASGFDEQLIRECFWIAATPRNGRGWYKLIDTGQVLGEVAAGDITLAPRSSGIALSAVEEWCYAP